MQSITIIEVACHIIRVSNGELAFPREMENHRAMLLIESHHLDLVVGMNQGEYTRFSWLVNDFIIEGDSVFFITEFHAAIFLFDTILYVNHKFHERKRPVWHGLRPIEYIFIYLYPVLHQIAVEATVRENQWQFVGKGLR